MPLPDQPPAPSWVQLGALPNRGLDLTGLRLPVLSIGNELLDGMTTVTNSVRYASFYSWTVLSYLNARRPDNKKEFRVFTDQVETAIALGNVLWNDRVVGVVGFDGAVAVVRAQTDPVPLEPLVEQSAANIYFNSLQQLKFTQPAAHHVPGLSVERGKPLAELVTRELSKSRLGQLFSEAKTVSDASLDELREFGELAHLTGVTDEEANLLIAGILPSEPKSDQERRRVATYACVLGLADQHSRVPTDTDFFEQVQSVNRDLPQDLHPHLNGWLRYSVRDVLAVAHEYLLKELIMGLARVSGSRPAVARVQVVESLLGDAHNHSAALATHGLLQPGEDPCEIGFSELYDRIKAGTLTDRTIEEGMTLWSGGISELALIQSIRSSPASSMALLPVAWCLASIRAAAWPDPEGNPFERRPGIGWSAIGVHEVIAPAVTKFRSERWTLGAVMSELALRTIDQHLRVSWSRMAFDVRHDVALLIADGDDWQNRSAQKHVLNYRPGRTASRLSQVISWLQQLHLVDGKGLTPHGKTVYRSCLGVVSEEAEYESS
jgi:hypothetical protein